MFSGADVMITRSVLYVYTFTCEYEFLTFPFDSQICHARITLLPSTGCEPLWNNGPTGIKVKGESSSFSMYSVSELRYSHEFTNNGSSWVHINVMLIRRFESYLLTTFIPCLVLVILGQVTLTHFARDDFQDRITVTLSLLIVVASLFSQVVAGLPNSPVPKIVEIFFFYCILRLGYVYLQHSSIEKNINTNNSKDNVVSSPNKIAVESSNNKLIAWILEEKPNQIKETPKRKSKLSDFTKTNFSSMLALFVDLAFVASLVIIVFLDKNNKENEFNNFYRTK